MTIRLTRRYRFAASHRLHSSKLSEAENQEVYGKCNNPFGHGHNYTIEIGVRGEIDPVTGSAVDVVQLDKLVLKHVVSQFDHRYLNQEIPVFAAVVPTAENIGMETRRRLEAVWPANFPALEKVRVQETRRNIIEL